MQICISQVRPFYEKRMGQEIEADTLGDEFKGYVVRITGGNDKQGFPMKQGVLTNGRVRLLLNKGHTCYRPRREVSTIYKYLFVASVKCVYCTYLYPALLFAIIDLWVY